MAVPLYDMTSVIVIRLREGRSPFRGDRSHFSHRLVERGLTPPQAVRTIDLVTLAGGLGALLLHRLDAAGACVVVAQTLCLLGVVALLEVSSNRPEPAMPRRNRPDVGARPMARRSPDEPPAPTGPRRVAERPEVEDDPSSRLGERLRRLALGLTGRPDLGAGLLAERARPQAEAGSGLVWVAGDAGRRRRSRLAGLIGGGRRGPLVVDRRRGHRPGRSWSG